MSENALPAPLHHVVGRVLKSCPFCGMEVCTHEAGFTHANNPNCFLFVMNANNGLTVPRNVYLERLYAAWDMRAEIAPNPSDQRAGASPAPMDRVVGLRANGSPAIEPWGHKPGKGPQHPRGCACGLCEQPTEEE